MAGTTPGPDSSRRETVSEEGLRRTDSVPTMGGFAGRHPDQPPNPPRHREDEPADGRPRAHDEVCVRSDAVAALELLRERVLARTRAELGIGRVSVPVFAGSAAPESIEVFLSRLLSDQNQLAARAASASSGSELRPALTAAFEAGVAETGELLAEVPGGGGAVVEQVAAEFARRIAELES